MIDDVVTLIALHYLLDLDYLKSNELGFNILQYFIFGDTSSPKDVIKPLDMAWKDYTMFTDPDN